MALTRAGRALYAAAFLVAAPLLLAGWAAATRGLVALPAVHSPALGVAIGMVGLALVLTGFADLWWRGGGLPMNADPPPRLVLRGSYRIVPHPIYTGFSLLCVGVAVLAGSASGLWLVSPVVMLSCAALVLGYEHHDLRRRFGPIRHGFLPPATTGPPAAVERVRCWLAVSLPWLVVLGLLQGRGAAGRGLAQALRLACMVVFAACPLLLRSQRALRYFAVRGLLALLFAFVLFLLLPMLVPAWPPAMQQGWGGALSAGLALLGPRIWAALRRRSERLTGSWREWRLGPLRVINHGFYPGLGGVLVVMMAGLFGGVPMLAAVVFAATAAVVGAALWAQWVEGSDELLRPFGFYGGLLGGTLGALAAPLFHSSAWGVLALFSLSGPWAQALGRLRCLVQGCCHGAPSAESVGIRYTHPRSRVCRMTPWAGMPLHPTPLYSLLWNAVAGLLLLRLWTLRTPLALIVGLYFLLSGIGRFAEEGWRGEPQTKIVAGLRLYQWAAVASLLLGMVFSAVGDRSPTPTPAPSWGVATAVALLFGLFVWAAMGMDFPESSRRFSRLS